MNIGELFVNLGIKGTEKTIGAITGMGKGLKQTASVSLETKAALIGVFYAMERLLSSSAKTGNMLTNFSALTGMSQELVQRYQYAARLVGASNEDMSGTFKTLQDQMTGIATGKVMPGGIDQMLKLTPEFGDLNALENSAHPEKIFERLKTYLRREKDAGFRNMIAETFGLSPNMMAAMTRPDSFSQKTLAEAPTLKDDELKQLDKVYQMWEKIETRIKMAAGHFSARFGVQLTNDIDGVVGKLIDLAEAFVNLAQKLHALEFVGKTFEAWTKILGGVKDVVDEVNELNSPDPKKRAAAEERFKDKKDTALYDLGNMADELLGDLKGFVTDIKDGAKNTLSTTALGVSDALIPKKAPTLKALPQASAPKAGITGIKMPAPAAIPSLKLVPAAAKPPMPVHQPKPAAAAPKVEVNQTINYPAVPKNAQQVSQDHKQAVNKAYRQLPSLSQGS